MHHLTDSREEFSSIFENALKSLKANRDVSTPGSSRHPATTSGSSSPKQASKRIALPTPETGPSAPRRAIQFREYDKSPSSSIALRRRDALDGHDDMRGVDRFLKAATGATGSVQGRALKQQSINTLKDATRCDEDEVDEDNIWQSQKKVRLDLKGKGMATAFSGREQGEYSNSVGIDVGYGNGERNGNVKRKSRHQALDERSGYDSPSQHVRALQAYYSKRAEHVLSIIDSRYDREIAKVTDLLNGFAKTSSELSARVGEHRQTMFRNRRASFLELRDGITSAYEKHLVRGVGEGLERLEKNRVSLIKLKESHIKDLERLDAKFAKEREDCIRKAREHVTEFLDAN